MKVAVIGTGRVGKVIGGGLVKAGHDVVVDAIPGAAVPGVLRPIGADILGEKVLLEVANDLSPDFELTYPNKSVGVAVQEEFPRLRVVRTLNTVQAPLMGNPTRLPAASTVFLAGNDAGAKAVASGLLVDLGWPRRWQIDLGDIAQARATEHFFSALSASHRPSTQSR